MTDQQRTQLRGGGAEHLVAGQLMIRGMTAYMAESGSEGFDLIAAQPSSGRLARIQVKSRWGKSESAFYVKNFGFDFLVFVRLNLSAADGEPIGPPEFLVFPRAVTENAYDTKSTPKVKLRLIPEASQYVEAWHLIRSFLNGASRRRSY